VKGCGRATLEMTRPLGGGQGKLSVEHLLSSGHDGAWGTVGLVAGIELPAAPGG
jgi:hypothetical protein